MAKTSRFREMAGDNDLTERTEQSYNTRDASGKYNDYFTEDMPLQKWACIEGDHRIDIIPFIAGKNHPNVPAGKGTHNVDVYVHFGIGVTESSYLCPARMGIGPCPICEFQAELKKQKNYDEKYVKSFNAKRRVVYNILCYDTNKDIDAGVMIWEASHHLAEKNILAIARSGRDGSFTKFADPDEGKNIEFRREGKGIGTNYIGFKFGERDNKREFISDEILDKAIAIDEYLNYLTYEELKEVLGNPGSGEQELGDPEESYEEVENRTPKRPVTSRRSEREEDPPRRGRQIKEIEPEEDPPRRGRNESDEPEPVRRGRRIEPEPEPEETPETGTTLRRRRTR